MTITVGSVVKVKTGCGLDDYLGDNYWLVDLLLPGRPDMVQLKDKVGKLLTVEAAIVEVV